MTNNINNKPAATVRYDSIRATIWANTGEKGTFHSIDFSRHYKDAKGNCQDPTSISGTDLLRLSRLASMAYGKVAELRSSDDQGDDAIE